MSFYDSFSERDDLKRSWDALFTLDGEDEASVLAKGIYRDFLKENYGEICMRIKKLDALDAAGVMRPETQPEVFFLATEALRQLGELLQSQDRNLDLRDRMEHALERLVADGSDPDLAGRLRYLLIWLGSYLGDFGRAAKHTVDGHAAAVEANGGAESEESIHFAILQAEAFVKMPGKRKEALSLLSRLLELFSDAEPVTIPAHLELSFGRTLTQMQQFKDAEVHYRKAFELTKDLCGSGAAICLEAMDGIALCLDGQGEQKVCMDMLQAAYQVSADLNGEGSNATAGRLSRMMKKYVAAGEQRQMRDYLKERFQKTKEEKGEWSVEARTIKEQLAVINGDCENVARDRRLMEEIYQKFDELPDLCLREREFVLKELRWCYDKLGDQDGFDRVNHDLEALMLEERGAGEEDGADTM